MSSGPWKFPTKCKLIRILRAAEEAGVAVDIKIYRLTGDLVIITKGADDCGADTPASEPSPPEDIVL
jgi:hypothetical protein